MRVIIIKVRYEKDGSVNDGGAQMTRANAKMTSSLEDYLEAIYFLNGKNDYVRVTDIAVELGISKPSVNRAVNTLKERGLVEHEHYGSLKLTEEGTSVARAVAERHIMLKSFLIEILGVESETAEEEACEIEHVLSADTISKMTNYLEKNRK